jgi:hypothetical protein
MSFPATFMARLVPINCGNAKCSGTSSHPKVTHCTTSERDRERENKNILYGRERRGEVCVEDHRLQASGARAWNTFKFTLYFHSLYRKKLIFLAFKMFSDFVT